ncbi:MAG TPA: class I SAM-dependent rRNA methyltransferase [Candidatus Handelsmanbacteria bacterium]|nr:class I SAM-dependent rRNA methyltransferase [Candidatus Handelsmanbacteria bacterium]
MSGYPQIRLRPNAERLLIKGHPWVFSGAVAERHPDAHRGSIVDVHNDAGRFIARGTCNPGAEIVVRILTRQADAQIDGAFLRARIERAVALRRGNPLLQSSDAMRLVHGESDGLPGLIVDDYAGWLVFQIHTAGMEALRAPIITAILDVVDPKGLFERSDVGTRRAEGLHDRPSGPIAGDEPPALIEFTEGEVQLAADVRRGQKTGFFLDQRDNRLLLGRIADGRSILNCFAFSGGFSAHAMRGGATSTLDIDIAPRALALGRRNVVANGDAPARAIAADAFAFLDTLSEGNGPRYGAVIVDPPSLVRKSRDVKSAMGVYTKLNRNALRLVENGGYLLASSCSTRITDEDFFQIIRRAASGARVHTRMVARTHHAADHPVDPAFPEGRYLTSALVQVDRD